MYRLTMEPLGTEAVIEIACAGDRGEEVELRIRDDQGNQQQARLSLAEVEFLADSLIMLRDTIKPQGCRCDE